MPEGGTTGEATLRSRASEPRDVVDAPCSGFRVGATGGAS